MDHTNELRRRSHIDVENGKQAYATTEPLDGFEGSGSNSKTAHEVGNVIELQDNKGFFKTLKKGEDWLDTKLGIETRGVDRIPDEEKQPPSSWNMFLLWWSLNVHVGVIPLGILGPAFGLTLGQSVASNIIGNILGAACTAYTGTLGPKVGSLFTKEVGAKLTMVHRPAFDRSRPHVTPLASTELILRRF